MNEWKFDLLSYAIGMAVMLIAQLIIIFWKML